MKKRTLRVALALLCLLCLLVSDAAPLTGLLPRASAVTQAEIDAAKKEQSALAAQKAELKAELKSIQSDKSKAVSRKENLDRQIALTNSEIAVAEQQIANYEALLEQTAQEMADTQEKERAQYELFCRRVRAMEERGTISYWSVLFHAASFSDLLSAMDFIGEIMKSDQRVIDELRDLQEQLAAQQTGYETAMQEQQAVKDGLAERSRELSELLAEAQKTISDIAADEAEYRKLIAAKEAEEAKQREEIDRLSRELAAQQNNTTATYGGYIWPCSSKYITSPVGSRYTGIPGASTNHAGIDIGRVGYNTQAVAAKAGTVIVSGYNIYRGNYVVVSHGPGNTTTYQHLSKRLVSVGDAVKQGQVLGITGSTGVSSGAHLHFEIMENGKIIDPLKYLTDYIKGWR